MPALYFRRFFASLAMAGLFAAGLTGCAPSTKKAPPNDQVRDAVAAALPPFLAVSGIELEPISTSPETAKVNFKATVTPKEDLYQVERAQAGEPVVTLLKPVQTTATKATIYGFVEARRTMDNWSLGTPAVPSGLQQFGQPRGAFNAQAFVAGSPEADGALKQQAVNAKKNEQASQALQEQRTKEEQATRQKLLQATALGVNYIGTLASGNQRQRIRLTFTEQKGFLIRAEAVNPDKPTDRQTFSGELAFSPRPSRNFFGNEKAYTILLNPTSRQQRVNGRLDFYEGEGTLSLNMTEDGLEGEARIANTYELRFQRE